MTNVQKIKYEILCNFIDCLTKDEQERWDWKEEASRYVLDEKNNEILHGIEYGY